MGRVAAGFRGNWRKGIADEPVVLERAGEVAGGNEQDSTRRMRSDFPFRWRRR